MTRLIYHSITILPSHYLHVNNFDSLKVSNRNHGRYNDMNILRIKEFREALKLSQRDVAKELEITQASFWRLEKGLSIPNAKQVLILCRLFKCTPNDLYGINDLHDAAILNWDK